MSLLSWLGVGDARRAEREAFLAALSSVAAVATEASKAAAVQSQAFQAILESWKVTDPPVLREFDDAAATSRYLDKTYGSQIDQMALPPELRGLDLAAQFQAVLDKLDS